MWFTLQIKKEKLIWSLNSYQENTFRVTSKYFGYMLFIFPQNFEGHEQMLKSNWTYNWTFNQLIN